MLEVLRFCWDEHPGLSTFWLLVTGFTLCFATPLQGIFLATVVYKREAGKEKES